MVQTIDQKPKTKPKSASSSRKLPSVLVAAFDGGNGYGKIILQGTKIKQHSYFAEIEVTPGMDAPMAQAGCLLQYLDGTRTGFKGKAWIIGEAAQMYCPQTYQRISDDARNKVDLGLQFFLGMLGTALHTTKHPSHEVHLMVSTHDTSLLGATEEAFAGRHTVRFNLHTQVTVEVHVLAVLPEGKGAFAQAILNGDGVDATKKRAITLDFGEGTIIATCMMPNGAIISSHPYFVGCRLLFESIANNRQLKECLGKPADSQKIRLAIENESFKYLGVHEFQEIYQTECRKWFYEHVQAILKRLEEFGTLDDTTFYAIGGGTALPGLAGKLQDLGFIVLPDGQWANVAGMYALAQREAKRFRKAATKSHESQKRG